MEFYSATKKNEILSFIGKWMELENIILSKASQVQKAKNHVFPHMQIIDLKQISVILLEMGHTLSGDHAQEA
jgi:hypothetical protein